MALWYQDVCDWFRFSDLESTLNHEVFINIEDRVRTVNGGGLAAHFVFVENEQILSGNHELSPF